MCNIVGVGVYDIPKTVLFSYGKIAEKYIQKMNTHYDNIFIDKYVIMPNHIHLILAVKNNGMSQAPSPTNAIIPKFISLFKRYCNREYGENLWQRSFHDHIIRGENDYREICEYIENNPLKWVEDCFYAE